MSVAHLKAKYTDDEHHTAEFRPFEQSNYLQVYDSCRAYKTAGGAKRLALLKQSL